MSSTNNLAPEARATGEAAGWKEYVSIARLDHVTKHVFVLPGILLAVLLLPLVLQSSVSPVNDVMDHAPHQISPESHP